jgi:NAD(P)-dependent dehydrogenase (short-subunit alcohol dehydrogenase family)
LGQAVLHVLHREGFAVSAAGRSRPEGVPVRRFEALDIRATGWERLYVELSEPSPAVDLVVFVAGSAVFGPAVRTPESDVRDVFEVNFWAPSRAALAAASFWRERRTPGRFVAVLSIAGRRAVPDEAYYGASKAAAARFLEVLDLEERDSGRRFLAVYPGRIRTPFRDSARWYGPRGEEPDYAASAEEVARKTVDVLLGRRRRRVFGLREQLIDLADRISPALYDSILARRRSRREKGSRAR